MFGCPCVEKVRPEHTAKENTCCQSTSTHRFSVNFLEVQSQIFHFFLRLPTQLRQVPNIRQWHKSATWMEANLKTRNNAPSKRKFRIKAQNNWARLSQKSRLCTPETMQQPHQEQRQEKVSLLINNIRKATGRKQLAILVYEDTSLSTHNSKKRQTRRSSSWFEGRGRSS